MSRNENFPVSRRFRAENEKKIGFFDQIFRFFAGGRIKIGLSRQTITIGTRSFIRLTAGFKSIARDRVEIKGASLSTRVGAKTDQ